MRPALPGRLAADCVRLAAAGEDLVLWWAGGEASGLGPASRLPDPNGQIAQRWGARAPGETFLVRPDQHLCARWTGDQPGVLEAALERAVGRSATRLAAGKHTSGTEPTPLEVAYDTLAGALDAVDEAARLQLLVKLALLCADTVGDPAHFSALVERARKSL